MKKLFRAIRIAVGVLVALAVVLLGGGFYMLHTEWLQQKLKTKALDLLTEKLQTRVTLDSVSVSLLTMDAELFGLNVEDRQQRKMLVMDYLQADVDLWPLLDGDIRVTEAKVQGLKAELHKVRKDSLSPDTVANFQFVIDAFKKDKKKAKAPKDSVSMKAKKKKLELIVNKFTAERIALTYNEDSVTLDRLRFTMPRHGAPKGSIEGLHGRWERTNKKGELVTHEALVTLLDYHEEDGERLVSLERVNFRTNNHRPRKNASKPKRGFFDVGHFNVWADLKLSIDRIAGDTVHGHLREMTARDSIMGIDIRKLQCEVTATKRGLRLEDVQIQQGEGTTLHFVRGDLMFPNKKTGEKLRYFTSTIGGTALLKDISRPFAPVLRKFSLPLMLSVRMEGNDDSMNFYDIVVTRPRQALTIKAKGRITGLKNKYDLRVHFDVNSMNTNAKEAITIINQFAVKKFMMEQLNALGNIRYKGSFNVLYKKEEFQGALSTRHGGLTFYFALDENNKYLSGWAQSTHLDIGKIMNMRDIGPVEAKANFKFDISKPRTALMRRRLGGKLPIGEVTAHVNHASYKFVKVSNVDVKIVSNGAIAEGSVMAPGSFADLSCTFSFTNTKEMQKMKIKPKVRFNLFRKKTEAEKAARAEEKAARKAAKEAEKADKAKEKAARKAAKEKEEAAEAKEKAARKAAKKAEKEARKEAKKAEKEARKASKEAEKAARKAAKESDN